MFRRRSVLALVVAIAVALGAGLAPVPRAEAADPKDFDPGRIISDQVFYDESTMSTAQIQSFLQSKVPTCTATTGPTCLKSYRTSISSRPAETGRCAAVTGRSDATAAQVIRIVATACGINPRVIIVLLEKEQSLVTATAPTSRQYRSATGYGCPDTADCDAAYYGFSNQVYMAALQFKRYAASPTGRAYEAGRWNSILYHPDTACGTKSVYIRNQATAGLYLYTPYTPNSAALANLYGVGDSCSSYGNRNFWRLFSDWFGSPTGSDSPSGEVTRVAGGFKRAVIEGWAVDPDAVDPIRVHVYADGSGAASVAADQAEPDGNRSRGFSATIALEPGTHELCAYGINVGAGRNVLLGCKRVLVRSGSPWGYIDQIDTAPGQVTFRGWAIDPDTPDPIRVHVYVDGRGRASLAADVEKAGLDRVYPGFGDGHGWSGTVEGLGGGEHDVCFYAINVLAGATKRIGCRTVEMPSGSPFGEIESGEAVRIGVVTVSGWAIDPDTVDPIRVHLYVDGSGAASLLADEDRPDVGEEHPGYGSAHGFTRELSGLPPGVHEVCAYGIDVGVGANRRLGCIDVSMPSGSPLGVIDEVSASSDGVLVRGWAFDPDTVDPIRVHVYVDGRGKASIEASLEKTGLSGVYPGMGDLHGYRTTLTDLSSGAHSVCVYAIDKVDPGENRRLGCRNVVVP
ncbi:hypothetical protein [Agromyces sp. SYSU T0242]|uniref:hypothetical protein n=1 Tax=Agromyces litoreus TaxID=3158561 RepID=UPI003396A184